ncbi:ROK family transcriptional regulator [Paracoccus tibetensis]|uniref:Sugar kinase of the NBD/HSP70 family, may contain an N-terminal HTH domain n=1 Tax=Paracoccus tibetensis TaxID=336292 RepID=A0A1G5C3U5_9RHOB|nr:ROK family transcriptional regulator [Paracoccus tibetensis]SCX97006.1 Sugar kinase of the NBD/HSP70 family, may contain an N-terminal HTH domain [Paracoccus tibetensis]
MPAKPQDSRGGRGIPRQGCSQNERLILSLIRRHGPMPRAVLALRTGLSAQAITNQTRRLIAAGLLDAGEVVRGKVGQPTTPLALSPDGALFLGLKIGRRLAELALVDFAGQIRLHRQEIHPYPAPGRIFDFARQGAQTILDGLPPAMRERVMGLGIATPYRLWDWGREMADWKGFDLAGRLADVLPFPVHLENDATTACGAELIFGRTDLPRDFIHIYVAHYAGGGLVLDGALRHGPTRNAGALGSMPVPGGRQLLDHAAIAALERRIGHALPPDDSGWSVPDEIERAWIAEAAEALAFAVLSSAALADLPLAVIDGAMPARTRTRLTEATARALAAMPAAGIDRPRVIQGSLGRTARLLGAAGLPLAHHFQPDGALDRSKAPLRLAEECA